MGCRLAIGLNVRTGELVSSFASSVQASQKGRKMKSQLLELLEDPDERSYELLDRTLEAVKHIIKHGKDFEAKATIEGIRLQKEDVLNRISKLLREHYTHIPDEQRFAFLDAYQNYGKRLFRWACDSIKERKIDYIEYQSLKNTRDDLFRREALLLRIDTDTMRKDTDTMIKGSEQTEVYTEINFAERTITIGDKKYSITSPKQWEFVNELKTNKKNGRITFSKDWKNSLDGLRRTLNGKNNLHRIIDFTKDGYKLKTKVTLIADGQVGIRPTY